MIEANSDEQAQAKAEAIADKFHPAKLDTGYEFETQDTDDFSGYLRKGESLLYSFEVTCRPITDNLSKEDRKLKYLTEPIKIKVWGKNPSEAEQNALNEFHENTAIEYPECFESNIEIRGIASW